MLVNCNLPARFAAGGQKIYGAWVNMEERYSVSQAAKKANVSEDQIRCAIANGELGAKVSENLGDYVIEEKDLREFIDHLTKQITLEKKRVVIIEDEINFANLLKLELSRDNRIEARFATWGRDGITLVRSFKPKVLVVDFMLPDIKAPDILNELEKQGIIQSVKVIVYSAHVSQIDESVKKQFTFDIIDKTLGMRNIIVKVYEALNLPTKVKPIK